VALPHTALATTQVAGAKMHQVGGVPQAVPTEEAHFPSSRVVALGATQEVVPGPTVGAALGAPEAEDRAGMPGGVEVDTPVVLLAGVPLAAGVAQAQERYACLTCHGAASEIDYADAHRLRQLEPEQGPLALQLRVRLCAAPRHRLAAPYLCPPLHHRCPWAARREACWLSATFAPLSPGPWSPFAHRQCLATGHRS